MEAGLAGTLTNREGMVPLRPLLLLAGLLLLPHAGRAAEIPDACLASLQRAAGCSSSKPGTRGACDACRVSAGLVAGCSQANVRDYCGALVGAASDLFHPLHDAHAAAALATGGARVVRGL